MWQVQRKFDGVRPWGCRGLRRSGNVLDNRYGRRQAARNGYVIHPPLLVSGRVAQGPLVVNRCFYLLSGVFFRVSLGT